MIKGPGLDLTVDGLVYGPRSKAILCTGEITTAKMHQSHIVIYTNYCSKTAFSCTKYSKYWSHIILLPFFHYLIWMQEDIRQKLEKKMIKTFYVSFKPGLLKRFAKRRATQKKLNVLNDLSISLSPQQSYAPPPPPMAPPSPGNTGGGGGGGGGHGGGLVEQLSKTNLYIRGLPPATTDQDLIKLCQPWVLFHSTVSKLQLVLSSAAELDSSPLFSVQLVVISFVWGQQQLIMRINSLLLTSRVPPLCFLRGKNTAQLGLTHPLPSALGSSTLTVCTETGTCTHSFIPCRCKPYNLKET